MREKPTVRKSKGRPKPSIASEVVEEARLAITARCRMTDANAHATLVLFALARALTREHPALGKLAAVAREMLDRMGEPIRQEDARTVLVDRYRIQIEPDWTSAQHFGVGVDDLTHRRFVVQAMSKMLVHQQHALARTDARRPPPLPAAHMAKTLSRMLASGPLRNLYTSKWTPGRDIDAELILGAWDNCVAVDGRMYVDENPDSLARKLVVRALVALGVPRKSALDGLARKAPGKKKVSERVRR
jgi:hypothetical protein